jgi:hypothetical protein
MQQTQRTDIFNDMKCYQWNVTTDETTRPETHRQLNIKQLNTFYKFNINEMYIKYEMKCQELQQALEKEIKIQPKLNYFNHVVKREYEIDTQNINYNKLNEDYNRHKILNYYHEYLSCPLLRPEFDFDNLDKMRNLKYIIIIMST